MTTSPSKLFRQTFPKICDSMPSFSKDCFGDFVEFQRVTIDPNEKVDSSKLLSLDPCSKSQPQASDPISIARTTCIHASINIVFQKEKNALSGAAENRAPAICQPGPREPQDLTVHACINLRLSGGLYTREFEKGARALKVRVEGPGSAWRICPRTECGHSSPMAVWCACSPTGARRFPAITSTTQPAAAFALLLDALRYREAPQRVGSSGGG
jgi:hypothetical protein